MKPSTLHPVHALAHRQPSSMDTSGEEIRTIFVNGLPHDIKEREINLLFRKNVGFEGAFLKITGMPAPTALAPLVLLHWGWYRVGELVACIRSGVINAT